MKLPISIDLTAISWANHEAKRLVHFKQGRKGQAPNWDRHSNTITSTQGPLPITDRSWWEGRYVLCPLRLRAQTDQGTLQLEIPDAVASVSRERRIVSTALVGRNGTVKEYVNDGDWTINIIAGLQAIRDGIVADEWPADELKQLLELLDVKDAIEVHGEFLDTFGIGKIVVKSHSVQQATESNYQTVNISAVSDDDYDIYSTTY